ncbi:hypothetical protein LEP1GSC021_1884 [Leptospira noguchii str. 1993005606]|uniref:Uncharacterized protein n=2 Tax=Leptospira noguchii TaxID=28182 RepID=M6Y565_9LEPT|nr:hypothetical protein [Leptospira noguchii]EMN02678.1 hypothetical protein LEP1GSC035_0247 [Leptospira noguchii str. 2007001578]EMO87091.1 hypothetical protein LEP1GSC024_4155 [Leptospira noguchii str. 2001034031]EPE82077.1 hypothetical protein LEP1GSC021_1884 [Leptospira noguchii str. 1993005606]
MNPKNRKSKTNSSKFPKKKPKKAAGKKKTTSPNLRKKTIKKIPLGTASRYVAEIRKELLALSATLCK